MQKKKEKIIVALVVYSNFFCYYQFKRNWIERNYFVLLFNRSIDECRNGRRITIRSHFHEPSHTNGWEYSPDLFHHIVKCESFGKRKMCVRTVFPTAFVPVMGSSLNSNYASKWILWIFAPLGISEGVWAASCPNGYIFKFKLMWCMLIWGLDPLLSVSFNNLIFVAVKSGHDKKKTEPRKN